jgi:hypothetical protein
MTPNAAIAPLQVFISYSPTDEALLKEMETHLASLIHQNKIQPWHKGAIAPGLEWDSEIKQQLETADLILLLISPSFMASDHCGTEMTRAIERHDAGNVRVIPILLRPVDREGSPFSKLQTLPRNDQAITTWSDRDKAFLHIVQELRTLLPSSPSSPPPHLPHLPFGYAHGKAHLPQSLHPPNSPPTTPIPGSDATPTSPT